MPIILCFSKEDIMFYFNDNEKMECGLFLGYKLKLKRNEIFNSLFNKDLK